ncbi:MAG: C25 family cysteine peptidase, partial [Candidatus Zophobacter franzmannii]|nr:C25 family cysteine peptidase [Candidatus Zophobacter franzmannii]
MKRTRIVFLITLLFTLSFQLIAIQDTEQDTVTRFNVLESTPTSTTLEFSLPEFKLVKQELNGIEFDKIETQCDGFVPELGQPELPLYSTMVAIPYSGSVSLEVLNKTSFQVDNFTAIPAQDYTIENEMERSFALDEDFYNSNIEYPVQAENISDPMIVRDFRVVSLTFTPFTYNPSTRSLTVSENITYKLTYNDEPSVNEMEAPTMYSPSFEPIYSSMIANYELVVDRTIPSHNMRLLMVYGGSSDAQYLAKMDEFVKWKKQKGYKVTTASTDDIGSSTTDVKAYIQSKYNNIYTRPEYVTLIGDVGGSFDISCFTVSGGASDYPYTHLAGDDIMGDVFIGRMPIENVDDFLTMANKAFIYERDPVPAPPTWYNHMLLVGYTNSAGQSSMYVNKFMKDSGLRVNPNYTFTELYGTPSSSTMQQTLNQGAAFFMYRGWIGMNGWDHPSEGEFTNGNKMTHCIINTCSTGDFNGTDATDAIVRYGSPAAPKGAITAIGMATAGTHTLMNNVLSSQTTNGIFSLGYRNMSAPLLSSKLLLYMVYHDFIPAYAVNFPGWCNLMGDPTVEVYIGPPQALTAEYPTEVFPGQTCYPVTVEDSNGTPMEDAIVTLVSDDFQLILHTDANGNAIFELP